MQNWAMMATLRTQTNERGKQLPGKPVDLIARAATSIYTYNKALN